METLSLKETVWPFESFRSIVCKIDIMLTIPENNSEMMFHIKKQELLAHLSVHYEI
jgi:hypothetical protein